LHLLKIGVYPYRVTNGFSPEGVGISRKWLITTCPVPEYQQ
jgi:hypothetical protein